MQESVLLLETDKQVVKDVTCSLRLVDIAVHAAGSVTELINEAKRKRPGLVITRAGVVGDEKAGVRLAEELASKEELAAVPVVLLCTSSERSAIEKYIEMFDAEVALPIEFPSVTYQIQEVLDKSTAEAKVSSMLLEPEMPLEDGVSKVMQAVEEGRGDLPTAAIKPMDCENRRRNLVIAYDIHIAVLRELEQSRMFGSLNSARVPQVVAAVTQSVCNAYDLQREGV
jgi:DNA-binding NtrC family response regulator